MNRNPFKQFALFLTLLVSLSMGLGCQAQNQESGEGADKSSTISTPAPAKAAPGTVKNLNAADFKALAGGTQKVQVLDVRTPAEWEGGVIPGAIRINFFDGDFLEQVKKLDPNLPLAIYCKSGGRSSQAANQLAGNGFGEVYNLTGGITGWQGAGYEVVK